MACVTVEIRCVTWREACVMVEKGWVTGSNPCVMVERGTWVPGLESFIGTSVVLGPCVAMRKGTVRFGYQRVMGGGGVGQIGAMRVPCRRQGTARRPQLSGSDCGGKFE